MKRKNYITATNTWLKKLSWVGVVLVSSLFCSQPSQADETVFWVDSQTGLAMSGFDPTSYFLSGMGFRGSRQYEYYWKGAVWRFENEGNLLAFRASPLTYAPQFGGHGTTKMAVNLKVSPNPNFSDVYENRLYLFHSKQLLDEWTKSKRKFVKSAQANWLALNYHEIDKNFITNHLNFSDVANKTAENLLAADAKSIAETQAEEKLQQELEIEMTIDEMVIAESEQVDLGPNGTLNSASRLGAAGKYFKNNQ